MKKIVFAIVGLAMLASCNEYQDFTPYKTAVFDISGEWYGNDACNISGNYGPYIINTFNTSSDSKDSLWIGNLFDSNFQLKVGISSDQKSFKATNTPIYDASNGPVEDTQLSADIDGKLVSEDSIYFDYTIYDNSASPATVVDQCGFGAHRRTGFEQ